MPRRILSRRKPPAPTRQSDGADRPGFRSTSPSLADIADPGSQDAASWRKVSPALTARLRKVKFLICDVDGVLTDATVLIGDGREFKMFHIRDGIAVRLLQGEGIQVGWVSARPSTATRQRADELRIDYLHQDKGSKVEAIEGLLKSAGLSWDQICFVGDDVVDLGALRRAGVAVAVADAISEVKKLAHYVTRVNGGHGAMREVATLLLKAQGRWEGVIARFSK